MHFIQLFCILFFLPPLIISLWVPFGTAWLYDGSLEVCIGMFIAYATLYPNMEWFGWVTMKWLAFAGLVLGTMQDLPTHAWGNLSVLWSVCLAAFLYIRYVQGRVSIDVDLDRFNPFRRRPKLNIVQKSTARRVVEPEDVYASVDPILDKIAKSGIGSLTPNERRALDRARARLLNKDSD